MAYLNYKPRCWSDEYEFIEYERWDKPCKAVHKVCGTEIYVTRTANFNHRKQKCPKCYPVWTKEKRREHARVTALAQQESEQHKQERIQRMREYSLRQSEETDKRNREYLNSLTNSTLVSMYTRQDKNAYRKFAVMKCNNCGVEHKYRIEVLKNKGFRCPVCDSFKHSKRELELLNYVRSLGYEAGPVKLDGYEIDIYIPQLHLGFEYNGIYWHSTNFTTPNEHYNKKLKFLRHNIQVLYLWEQNDDINEQIIYAIVNNKELPQQIKYVTYNNQQYLNADVQVIIDKAKWNKPFIQEVEYANTKFEFYNSGYIKE